jgi:hypothetical protein
MSFGVARAPTLTVDSLPYAYVSGIHAAAIYYGGAAVPAVFSGTLPSDCMELGAVDVRRTGDVFVVLPTLRVLEGKACENRPVTFERRVDLGPLPKGRYMIHVRSANGEARFHTFSVDAPRPPIEGGEDGMFLAHPRGHE